MTFRDVVVKNLKAHARRYLSFFLCNSFTIMVFFMFASIYFNNSINGTLKNSTRDIFDATLISILFFSFLFLGYAYTSFSKSRKREFGLFLILGMSNRSLRKVLLIENSLIVSVSLVTGLVAGTVFSRLFFLVVVTLLDLEGIRFQFQPAGYASAIALFLTEFLAIMAIGSIAASRAGILEGFRSSRTVDRDWLKSPLFGLAGVLLLALSFLLKYWNTVGRIHIREMSTLFVLLCFTGLFLTIAQFGNVLVFLSKRNKSLYYRNLPGISGIRHKIFRSKTILFLIAMLTAITVYFMGTALATLRQADATAQKDQPWHLAFVEKKGADSISEQELERILNSGEEKPARQKKLAFIEARLQSTYGYGFDITVLSDKAYGELDKVRTAVEKGHCILVYPDEMLPSEGDRLTTSECFLSAGSKTYRYKLQEQRFGRPVNKIGSLSSVFLILNDSDYGVLTNKETEKQTGYIRLVNYPDWRRTSKISEALEDRLAVSGTLSEAERYKYGRDYPLLGSRVTAYERIRSEGSLLLFLTTFLGALFFVSSASVLSFRLFSEIGEEREKYRKFHSIGIRKKEFRKYLSWELGILFFLPPAVGIPTAFAYTGIDLLNSTLRTDSLGSLLAVTSGYLLLQVIFFLVVSRKYSMGIMNYSCRSSLE